MTEVRSREKAKADRKKQIMEAALKVFSEKGFERATTKAIAAEAGIAEGTIFIYFSTKRDLLISCMKQEIFEPLPEIFSNESASDEEIIRTFFKNRFTMLRKNFGLVKLIISEGLYNAELRNEFFERVFSPALSEVSRYFTRRVESGAFKNLDPTFIARSLIGQIVFSIWMQVVAGMNLDEPLNDGLIDTMVVTLLDGIRA